MAVNEYGAKTVLSRRTFVGGAMLAGTAIALFGLGGCAPRGTASTGSAASFTPGDLTPARRMASSILSLWKPSSPKTPLSR